MDLIETVLVALLHFIVLTDLLDPLPIEIGFLGFEMSRLARTCGLFHNCFPSVAVTTRRKTNTRLACCNEPREEFGSFRGIRQEEETGLVPTVC